MNSYLSWAIFLAVLGGLSWYYTGRPNWLISNKPEKPGSRSSRHAATVNSGKTKAKAKHDKDRDIGRDEDRSDHQTPTSEANINKKRKIVSSRLGSDAKPQSSQNEIPGQGALTPHLNAEVTDNAEFAREMAIARAGTQLRPADKSDSSKKAHQPRSNGGHQPRSGTDSPSLSTGPSSTGGADGDDDLSPAASPSLAPTSTAPTTKVSDVSDMLAPPAKGPSVVRLTGSTNPASTSRPKQAEKVFERAETKKQRQHRLKREAKRADAEEVERERRKLMEKQIRGARMAEGTSAQTKTSAFKPPTENPWFSNPSKPSSEAVGGSPNQPPPPPPPLLDTFHTDSRSKQPNVAATQNLTSGDRNQTNGGQMGDARGESNAPGISTAENARGGWPKELPLEEEQSRLIHNSQDSWTTVSKRDKKKVTKPQESRGNDTSDTSGVESHHASGPRSQETTSARPPMPNSSNSYHQLNDFGLQDSDWAAG